MFEVGVFGRVVIVLVVLVDFVVGSVMFVMLLRWEGVIGFYIELGFWLLLVLLGWVICSCVVNVVCDLDLVVVNVVFFR